MAFLFFNAFGFIYEKNNYGGNSALALFKW